MILRNILALFLFFLPFHALLVTIFQCKIGIDTNILRFWKELIVTWVALFLFFREYKNAHWSLKNIYKNNTLLGLTTAFIICSAIYMYFPFFELKAASVLGFRYDVYFLICLIIGIYAHQTQQISFFLKTVFFSALTIIIVFLPWYAFGDIQSTTHIFGFSDKVSTYSANECLSFSQNVEWHHRFQATFGGPIRMSVFFTLVGSLFMGWLLSQKNMSGRKKYILGTSFLFLLLTSIIFSYSKTSILGAIFTTAIFVLLSYKFILRKKISPKFYAGMISLFTLPIALIALFKWELFLHLGAMINRLDNLKMSMEMFFYNPIWYGLGIAGPASQIGNSIESAGSWQIATASVTMIHRFLPENWYVQIALEQWIIGLSLFVSLLAFIGYRLISHIQKSRSYISVGVASAYFGLCFMALFTHAFEEAASAYMLFFFIGIILAESVAQEKHETLHKKHSS